MQLLDLIDNSYQQLLAERSDIFDAPAPSLEKHRKIAQRINAELTAINSQLRNFTFKSHTEEIVCFKNKIPLFYADYFYHTSIFDIESSRPIGTPNSLLKHYILELKKIEYNSRKDLELYRYFRSNSSHNDQRYFTRSGNEEDEQMDPMSPIIDKQCCTVYTIKMASFITYEMLKEYLVKALGRINEPEAAVNDLLVALKWTDTKTGLIELIYALQEAGCFNNGQATLKQITTFFEKVFHVELGNTSRSFQVIMSRKMEYANFLEKLKQRFLQRIDRNEQRHIKA